MKSINSIAVVVSGRSCDWWRQEDKDCETVIIPHDTIYKLGSFRKLYLSFPPLI